MLFVVWFFLAVYIMCFLVMIPLYRMLAGLKERQARTGLSQFELYENMSFEEEQLHFHIQENLFNIPSAIVADIIYRSKHRK